MNLNSVKVTINIAGRIVLYSKMTLTQKMNAHHRLEVVVDHDAFGDKAWMQDPVKIIKLIGESISVIMKHTLTGETNVFNGLVSNVSLTGYHGLNNHIVIEGISETVKLAGKPNMDSFVHKTLEQIVNESVQNSGNGALVTAKPEYVQPIDFQMQYNESCFDFLNRMSYLYGECFYSKDGSDVFFGKPTLDDPVDIKYDIDMTDFSLRASLLPPRFQHYNYLEAYHEEKIKSTRKSVPEAAGYLQPALKKSEGIYTSEVSTPLEGLVHDPDSLLRMVDIERTRTVADMLVLSGSTHTCKIGLGRVITVSFPGNAQISTSPGAFVLTQVIHTVSQEGHYTNTFSGVRAALGYIPIAAVALPIPAPQRATVLSNADPLGKGRIQVQFQWQKYVSKQTNWIRVQSPDAGGTANVLKNRGFVFIPEEGDEVMVLFENNDPARPYCTGSLFSVDTAQGGFVNNHLKTIKTRSGHTIALDDAEESLSVTIKDRKNNLIHIDSASNDITITANRHITINATETMTFNAKNININATENVEINATNIKENASQNIALSTEHMTTTANSDYSLYSESIKEVGDVVEIHSQKENMTLYSKKNVETKSGSKKIRLS
ncbi:MAG: hypothetical protein RL662_465 [Bacteroidota bacterium]|jgi:uncharacterized protein involved in type VI secretion and phage assembly